MRRACPLAGDHVGLELDMVIRVDGEAIGFAHPSLAAVREDEHALAVGAHVDDAEVRALEAEVGRQRFLLSTSAMLRCVEPVQILSRDGVHPRRRRTRQ